MIGFRRSGAAAAVVSCALLWGCGNASVPESATGSVSGRVVNPGPITFVHFRQIIAGDVTSPTNSSVNQPVNADGTFTIPVAPQGPVTMEFMDARQVPYAYSELVVQPGANTVPDVQGPDPLSGGQIQAGQPVPFTPTLTPAQAVVPGSFSIRAFGPGGQPVAAQVVLYNVNLQGGPTGSVGNGNPIPTATDPTGVLNSQTDPFTTFQGQQLAHVSINGTGAPVSIFGLPTGGPGLTQSATAGGVTSSTDASGNVTLSSVPGASVINPTGGGYQLVPQPITLNGQTLVARQVFLDSIPGINTHVDLFYSTVL